jgi:hypothetical protein
MSTDLPIAIGILLASEQIFADLDGAIIMGELSLDGGVRHVSGVLPMAHAAHEQGYKTLYVPAEDAAEASLIDGLEVYPIPNLLVLIDHLTGHARLAPFQCDYSLEDAEDLPPYAADLAEIKGQIPTQSVDDNGGVVLAHSIISSIARERAKMSSLSMGVMKVHSNWSMRIRRTSSAFFSLIMIS